MLSLAGAAAAAAAADLHLAFRAVRAAVATGRLAAEPVAASIVPTPVSPYSVLESLASGCSATFLLLETIVFADFVGVRALCIDRREPRLEAASQGRHGLRRKAVRFDASIFSALSVRSISKATEQLPTLDAKTNAHHNCTDLESSDARP